MSVMQIIQQTVKNQFGINCRIFENKVIFDTTVKMSIVEHLEKKFTDIGFSVEDDTIIIYIN